MNAGQRERLKKHQDNLQQEWNIRNEKLARLRCEWAIETAAANKFQLEKQIQAEETQLNTLDAELRKIALILNSENFSTPAQNVAEPRDELLIKRQQFLKWIIFGGIGTGITFITYQSIESAVVPSKYSTLEALLKAERWKEADQATRIVMLKIVRVIEEVVVEKGGNEIIGDNDVLGDSVRYFPCNDLRQIDQLWVKYSRGKFGFSVQKRIYLEVGGNLDGQYPDDEVWKRFCDHVGWRVNEKFVGYSDLKFNTSASNQGELPAMGVSGSGFWCNFFGWWSCGQVSSLAWRFLDCSL